MYLSHGYSRREIYECWSWRINLNINCQLHVLPWRVSFDYMFSVRRAEMLACNSSGLVPRRLSSGGGGAILALCSGTCSILMKKQTQRFYYICRSLRTAQWSIPVKGWVGLVVQCRERLEKYSFCFLEDVDLYEKFMVSYIFHSSAKRKQVFQCCKCPVRSF